MSRKMRRWRLVSVRHRVTRSLRSRRWRSPPEGTRYEGDCTTDGHDLSPHLVISNEPISSRKGGDTDREASVFHHTTVLIYWLGLCASPIIVSIVFTPDAAGKRLPSQTKRFFTPCTSPCSLVIAALVSAPIRAAPRCWSVDL